MAVDRWDDEDAEADGPARGAPRSNDDLDLSWDGVDRDWDPDGHRDADPLAEPDFDDLYGPDELAAIEAGPRLHVEEPVSKVSQWRRRSALGAVITGMALGLQEVFDPEEERSIVIEVDDDGLPTELPVQMILDPDSPAGSLCIVHRADVPPPVI